MDSKQFAWLYLVENGYSGVVPSYYGGWDSFDQNHRKYYDYRELKKEAAAALKQIHRVGVDWERTEAPTSNMRSQFEGTFADASSKEYLEGDLVLKDSTVQHWCAEALNVTNVFDMMAAVHQAADKFKRAFNE